VGMRASSLRQRAETNLEWWDEQCGGRKPCCKEVGMDNALPLMFRHLFKPLYTAIILTWDGLVVGLPESESVTWLYPSIQPHRSYQNVMSSPLMQQDTLCLHKRIYWALTEKISNSLRAREVVLSGQKKIVSLSLCWTQHEVLSARRPCGRSLDGYVLNFRKHIKILSWYVFCGMKQKMLFSLGANREGVGSW
jgi:hypothetical protein